MNFHFCFNALCNELRKSIFEKVQVNYFGPDLDSWDKKHYILHKTIIVLVILLMQKCLLHESVDLLAIFQCMYLPVYCMSLSLTHHSSSVSLHELDDPSWVLVPQVDVSTVAATDHKLAARPVEVHPLHCEEDMKKGEDRHVQLTAKCLTSWATPDKSDF